MFSFQISIYFIYLRIFFSAYKNLLYLKKVWSLNYILQIILKLSFNTIVLRSSFSFFLSKFVEHKTNNVFLFNVWWKFHHEICFRTEVLHLENLLHGNYRLVLEQMDLIDSFNFRYCWKIYKFWKKRNWIIKFVLECTLSMKLGNSEIPLWLQTTLYQNLKYLLVLQIEFSHMVVI